MHKQEMRYDLNLLASLYRLTGSNAGYLQRQLEKFLASCGLALEGMHSALLTRDWEQLRTLSHRISGSAAMLGLCRVGSLAQQIEIESQRAEPSQGKLYDLYHRLECETREVRALSMLDDFEDMFALSKD